MIVARWMVLVLGGVVTMPVGAAELTLLEDNKRIVGEFVSIDEKTITLKAAAGPVATPLDQVLLFDFRHAYAPSDAKTPITEVLLNDGTLLRCTDFRIKQREFTLTVLPNRSVTVPMNAIFTLVRNAQDPAVKGQWRTVMTRRGKRDAFVIAGMGGLEAIEGTLGAANDAGDRIAFEFVDGRKSEKGLKLADMKGMVFQHLGGGEIRQRQCRVIDLHRNVLAASKVESKDKGIRVTTVSGVVIEYPTLSDVIQLDFSQGKLTFLSDLEPVDVEQTSTEDRIDQYRRDKNLDDKPIQLEGVKEVKKGLTLHSRTVLVYDIGGDYKEFKAILGVDKSVTTNSEIMVKIESVDDNRELFKGLVRRKDAPRPITLDVRDVKQLRITAEAPGLDLGNQVSLAEARVSK